MEDKRKKAPQHGWGPIVVERRSTRTRMGAGTMLEKAQNLKMKSNLEEPKGKMLPISNSNFDNNLG